MPKIVLARFFITICSLLLCLFFYAMDPSLAPQLLLLFAVALLTDISRYWGKRIRLEKAKGAYSPLSKTPKIIQDFFLSGEKIESYPKADKKNTIPFYIALFFALGISTALGLTSHQAKRDLFQSIKIAYYEQTGQNEKLLALLREMAEEGHVDAQYGLALVLHNGLAGPKDHETALKWFTSAATHGHTKSQIALGDIYLDGDGVIPDCHKASTYFKAAISDGSELAQLKLARMHLKGLCGPKDDKAAFDLLLPVAQKGNDLAQFTVSLMYKDGRGVEKNAQESLMWLRKAAANGNASAAEFLKKYGID